MAGRVGLEDSDMRDDQFGGPLYGEKGGDTDYETGKGAPLVDEVESYEGRFNLDDTQYDSVDEMHEDTGLPVPAIKAALDGDEKAIEYIEGDDISPGVSRTSSLTYTRKGVLIKKK